MTYTRQNRALGAMGAGEVDAVAAAAASIQMLSTPSGRVSKPLSAAELARREEKRAAWAAIEAKHVKDRWWRDNKPTLIKCAAAAGLAGAALLYMRSR